MARHLKNILIFLSLCWRLLGIAPAYAEEGGPYRLSDPVTFRNLAIYFVHGASRGGPVPLTLQEALAKKAVTVSETGQVNELKVENTGDEAIFIQSGDIVKGGQQDRVLSVSVLLPPHSGAMAISSFCVESGRWSARGAEDARTFSSSASAVPSRVAKLEMAGAAAPKPDGTTAPAGARQQEIWKSVAEVQGKLTRSLGAPVAAQKSQSSLQLALENGRLAEEQAAYIAALQGKGEEGTEIIGYVLAVNGKVNSADIYPSNGLFRKMWPKLLRASVTEAIGERDDKAAPPPAPPVADVDGFLADAAKAKLVEKDTKEKTKVGVRENTNVMSVETRPADVPAAAWVHRNYIAK
jgi:ARG/rhodanese/phosphatase superfamily protein